MLLAALWIVCVFAAGWLAADKGRSPLGFVLAGLVAGPIGVLVALGARPDDEQLRAAALSAGQVRVCPSCAEVVRRQASRCRYCHDALPPITAQAPTTPRWTSGPDSLDRRAGKTPRGTPPSISAPEAP